MVISCRKAMSTAIIGLPVRTLWLSAIGSSVQANGQSVPILETTQGPYRVEVRVSPPTPRVGNLHMVIVLRTLEEGEPVNDVSVRVSALGPEPKSLLVGTIETYTVPPTLNWYDFNIALLQEGEWSFTVDIAENDQLTRIEFSLRVEAGGINWGIVIVLISAIPLLVAVVWYFQQYARNRLSR